MSKVFFCEKFCQAKDISILTEIGDIIILAPSIAAYQFNLPKSLVFRDAPYSGFSPKYKKSQTNKSIKRVLFSDEGFALVNINEDLEKYEVASYLASFDEWVYSCDSDHSGVRGFDLFCSIVLNIHDLGGFLKSHDIELEYMIYSATDTKTLKTSFRKRNDDANFEIIQTLRVAYLNKDYFDYNYLINSTMFFNKIYRHIFNDKPIYSITRNFIQSLFLIEKNQSISMAKMIRKMESLSLGSFASRYEIIKRLLGLCLIVKINDEIKLSLVGEAFIKLLHRRVNDPYLSQRLNNDFIDLRNEEFIDKYNTYLKDIFSKQKRFLNRNNV